MVLCSGEALKQVHAPEAITLKSAEARHLPLFRFYLLQIDTQFRKLPLSFFSNKKVLFPMKLPDKPALSNKLLQQQSAKLAANVGITGFCR